jgi:hypothetical protein
MLDLPDYARKWELKKHRYAENGILSHDEGGGPTGVLVWTDDRKSADAQAWLALAAEVRASTSPCLVGLRRRRRGCDASRGMRAPAVMTRQR